VLVYMCVNSLHNLKVLVAADSAQFERIQLATIYFTCTDSGVAASVNADVSYRK